MRLVLFGHIAAGSLALVFGYVALFAAKGQSIHRRSGRLFVAAMMVMAVGAVLIGMARSKEIGLIGGAFTAYLVITALTTVLEPVPGARWLDRGGLVLVLGTASVYLVLGLEAVARGGQWEGVFAPVLFLFAVVSLMAAAGDVRVMRAGPLRGGARVARHLWRMCFGLYIATGSFFLGQADELPAALRIWPLLALLAFLPLLAMFYWLWRVRMRGSLRGIVVGAAAQAA